MYVEKIPETCPHRLHLNDDPNATKNLINRLNSQF